MEYVNIGIGLFRIACGFLVKKYPSLISGYNTISQKKKVNIDGLSTWIRNAI
ncbi:DUF3784 domain-containing protein [Fulvivirga sp. 29W222]|uniref:DUF3784 domain-containing protein n=1 Tax=Fulvivirga marina TaxID=2494733 RepID=A0A937FUV6_9BACT|nr:DUF3784 domain-containing protein [Fulvivirga marina]MBL6445423.1 DUF3784 domain-containing protein [Fulvivirga marina]